MFFYESVYVNNVYLFGLLLLTHTAVFWSPPLQQYLLPDLLPLTMAEGVRDAASSQAAPFIPFQKFAPGTQRFSLAGSGRSWELAGSGQSNLVAESTAPGGLLARAHMWTPSLPSHAPLGMSPHCLLFHH